MHLDDRIALEPGTPRKGQEVRVEYRGLLAQNGADSVWMRCGIDGWHNVEDIPMEQTPEGNFSCITRAEGNQEFNLCFKDSADHWDNNNGENWSFSID